MRNKYMDLSWNTLNMGSLPSVSKKEEVSPEQLTSLLKSRTFGCPPEETCCVNFRIADPAKVKELEEFCQRHGIVGINFGNVIDPAHILETLKSRMGYKEAVKPAQKGLLYG